MQIYLLYANHVDFIRQGLVPDLGPLHCIKYYCYQQNLSFTSCAV